MNALPPAGWFPDPEAGGRWRWWDGQQWAPPGWGYAPAFGYDPAARARTLAAHAGTTSRIGNWLRFVFVAYAASTLLLAVGIAIAFRRGISFVPSNHADGTASFPTSFFALQLLSLPADFVGISHLVLFILWVYNAGKFADLQGWPRARDRGLGALSLLIPIVNLWWPYEAVRDLFPPGARPRYLVGWWVSYLVVPFAVFASVLVATLTGSLLICCAVLVAAAFALMIPATLGWRLVRDLDELHRHLSLGAGAA